MSNQRAALYLRVSTDEQTIENQRSALTSFVTQRGWTLDLKHIFTDHAASGALPHSKRPGLTQALQAAQKQEFDVLACWDISRLSRSLSDLLEITQQLDRSRVALVVQQQQFDMT